MNPKEEPELRPIDGDTDDEDGVAVGQDAVPDVQTASVAAFEIEPEAETAAGTEPQP